LIHKLHSANLFLFCSSFPVIPSESLRFWEARSTRMTKFNGNSRNFFVRCLSIVLAVAGISCCRGLSLGQSPFHGSVRHNGGPLRSTPTMLFGASSKRSNARCRLVKSKSVSSHRFRKKEGSELYGYLDKLDRASGLNYNDYWGRKRNTTDLVDSMQIAVESAPKPFNKLVSPEMWYVSSLCSSC